MSYTVQYINKFGFVPACHQSHKIKDQQFFDNLETCIRKEFDEKINNAVKEKEKNSVFSELIERIDYLEEENKEIRNLYDQTLHKMETEMKILKQALAETLAALASK